MCPNCGTKLSCGCQKRTASDGKQVCQNCITQYETALKNKKAQQEQLLKMAAMNAAINASTTSTQN